MLNSEQSRKCTPSGANRVARLAIIVLAFSAVAAVAEPAPRVIAVADGDTLTILQDQKQIKVRLAEIDAPERKQPFGTRSRQSLADLCFQKPAKLKIVDIDRYGRTVARITCAGVDANTEQVRRGMAWVYDRYVVDKALYGVQDAARQRKDGLWGDSAPVPPWEWRRMQ